MDIQELQQAVGLALQSPDQSIRQQALEYCNSVQASPQGWRTALQVLALASAAQETVFFAYQVLEAQLQALAPENLRIAKDQISTHYTQVAAADPPPHLKAKLASVMGKLFKAAYSDLWPFFFRDLRALDSPVAKELYARVLCVVHEEIGDTLILHDAATIKVNNALKDLVRERDMIDMIDGWRHTLESTPPSSPQSIRILDQTLQAIAGYVSWVDIAALFSNPQMAPLIFNQFDTPALCLPAADALHEICSKKMPPQNKLELLMLLQVQKFAKTASQNHDEEYAQRFARTLAAIQLELLQVLNQTTDEDPTVASRAEQIFVEIMPEIFQLLGNPSTEVASHVIPVLNEYFQWVRKGARKQRAAFDTSQLPKNSFGQPIGMPADSTFISADRRQLVKHLFESVIEKSLYSDEESWEEENEEFQDLRAKLKVLQDQVSSIDVDLFVDEISSFVQSRFEHAPSKWQEAELALYELGILSETAKIIKTPRGVESRAQQVLLELFVMMVNSNLAGIDHPSIQLAFMDLVYRHAQYLEKVDRAVLMKALERFISPLGVHNSNQKVRTRSWYLFYKVFKSVRKQLVGEPSVATTIFASLSSLLVIGGSGQPDDQEEEDTFNKQLYLFELCGMLFVNSSYEDGQLTHELLDRLFGNLQKAVDTAKSTQDQAELGQQRVNRTLMALGTFTRGMCEAASLEKFQVSPIAQEMQGAAKVVIAVLEQLADTRVVREACRFTFSRLVTLLGSHIIIEISQLINCLLNTCTAEELPDFLSFLGQLAHLFKTDEDIFTMFASLATPLFERTFVFLSAADSEAQGGSTDSQVLRRELIRSYIQFVQGLFNNQYGSVFLVSTNQQTLENVLQSLFHYANNQKDVQSQKLAIVCLAKIVSVWGSGSVPAGEVGAGQAVGLFSSPEIFLKLNELCWSLTTKPDFPLRDAQTRLVVMELGGLQKCMWEARGQWYGDLSINFLEKAGLSSDLARNFVGQLAGAAAKEFKRGFYDFLVQLRQ